MAKTSGKVTFIGRVIVTILKDGTSPITEAEVELAMLNTELAVNNMRIPEVIEGKIKVQPYIRLHIQDEVDRKGVFKDGNDKDKDLAGR